MRALKRRAGGFRRCCTVLAALGAASLLSATAGAEAVTFTESFSIPVTPGS